MPTPGSCQTPTWCLAEMISSWIHVLPLQLHPVISEGWAATGRKLPLEKRLRPWVQPLRQEGSQGKSFHCLCPWSVTTLADVCWACSHYRAQARGPGGGGKHFKPWSVTVLLLLLHAHLGRGWFLPLSCLVVGNAGSWLALWITELGRRPGCVGCPRAGSLGSLFLVWCYFVVATGLWALNMQKSVLCRDGPCPTLADIS